MCFFFRFWKSCSSASFRSCWDFRSIAGMYFFTADAFLYVLEVFSKAIHRFGWWFDACVQSVALICTDIRPLGQCSPSGAGELDMSARDGAMVTSYQLNRLISFGNGSKTYRNESAVIKYIPAMLRRFSQLLKLSKLCDFQNLKKNTCFDLIKKKWNYMSSLARSGQECQDII